MLLVAFVAVETISTTREMHGVSIFSPFGFHALPAKVLAASQTFVGVIFLVTGIANFKEAFDFLFHGVSSCGWMVSTGNSGD